jgi:DNA polymerase-3 subunit alpha
MSDNQNFVHLHVHTIFSLLDGISRREDLAKRAKAFGMPALAITDHGNIFNAVSFYKTCHDVGIKPIIGQEFYVAPDTRFGREYSNKAQSQKEAEDGDLSYYAYHLGVIARNREGYENLKKLSTIAYREGFYKKPRIDLEILAAHKEGLIVLSGCLASMTSRFIVAGEMDKAMDMIDKQRAIFGENFFLELMHHDIGGEETVVNEALVDIGNKHGIPLLMTNDSHYTDKDDAVAQEVALCIGTNKMMSDPKHFRFNGEGYWFKTAKEMQDTALLAGFPQSSLDNTLLVNNMVEDYGFKLTSKKHPPQVPLFRNEAGDPVPAEQCHIDLATKAWMGLMERGLAEIPKYQERLTFELETIKEKNFSSYFLIIADIVEFMRKNGIPTGVGRGSAGSALTCYSLRITDMDPILYKMPFSRFINPGRKDLPDIDTDISQARRHEVINYIVNKYGKDKVGQIVTFTSLGAKAALDNVGRALGVPSAIRRQVGHLIGDTGPDDSVDDVTESNKKVMELVTTVPEWLNVSKKLEGNNKNLSAHAAGIVIANTPLADQVPLIRDSKEGYLVTQYDMKDLQELGLLKLDMLGLKTLDLIQGTFDLIRERHGVHLEYSKIPLNDAATYQTVANGKFVSVFQFDSSGIRAAAKQLWPDRFDHLVALNALYRPGPMLPGSGTNGKSIMDNYFERRHGREQVELWHHELADVLQDTYGLPIFQEQLMYVSQIIAGFTEAEADEFRSAVGKKDKVKFDAACAKFKERGLAYTGGKEPRTVALMDDLIKKIEGFARYAWNISHSVCYSELSYATAWLETNYSLEYYTCLLNTNVSDNDKLKANLSAILQKGIKILPPHVNNSKAEFYTDGKHIYMGLSSIRNMGDVALDIIMKDRQKNGDYKDFLDFCLRMGPNGKVTKLHKDNLIKAGAFNWDTRYTAKDKYENVELLQKIYKKFQEKTTDEIIRKQFDEKFVETGKDWDESERLNHERTVLNFYISSHPVTTFAPLFNLFPQINFITPSQLADQQLNSKVVMLGVVESKEMKTTQKGDPFIRMKVGDQMGAVDVMVWSPLASQVYGKLADQQLVFVTGGVREDKFRAGEFQIYVNNVSPVASSGIPINSFYAADQTTANRVIQALNCDVGAMSDGLRDMGTIVTLKSVAFIKPEHFELLKHERVNYQVSM